MVEGDLMNLTRVSHAPDDDIEIRNGSSRAIAQAQIAFSNAAKELDIHNEEDIQSLVDEIRHEEK